MAPHIGDHAQTTPDKVAYVMAGGENVNLLLVTKGAAAPYFYFGRQGRYAHQRSGGAVCVGWHAG